MRLPQIQIQTTDIQIDLQIHKPVQHIEQPRAQQSIAQPAATLEIHTRKGELSIDSSDARRDLGYYPTGEMIKRYAQEGHQEMMKGISRRIREGRQMMLSAGKGQEGAVIQQIAVQNTGPKRPGPYNIKFIPSIGSVKIKYKPATVDVNIQRNQPNIDVKVNKPIHDYTPGKVTGTMIQRPRVDIDVIG
ncbi:DUF6470 family protein [Metasolibacillus sp.]|uniref:DUF6470 family protein n=1 Tax=Metasolibacillus sp. TaxID=2703680 RepID=UPI0025D2F398|nr:DUF6470 family protein [Metasolibacillus sp.]MCT6925681.1 DUF6470 family protein [Metasolibacillus sp.]MCT6941001.1 DUF6470 family protein [Metasolibacillus sp.]